MKKYVQYIPTKDRKSFKRIEHDKPLSAFKSKIRRLRKAVKDLGLKSVNDLKGWDRVKLLREVGFKPSQFKLSI